MTKLESGAVVPNAALHDLDEIVGSALRRAGKILAQHKVELELTAPAFQCSNLDAVLFEQALFNILDNAAKYPCRHYHPRPELAADPDAIYLQVLG